MKSWSTALLALALGSCVSRPGVDEGALARVRSFSEGVEQARLMSDVNALVASHQEDTPLSCDLFEPGTNSERRPVCHITRERSRQFVRARLESLGFRVTTHDVDDPRFPTTNLIAELPGTEHPEEIVLVGAHYDSYFLGADDNSSGVAALLEMARLASGQRFKRTVRFLGFDLEELGLVGSTRYVQSRPDERIVASLIFDCIGYRDMAPGSQQGLPGFPLPPRGDFLAVIANEPSRAQMEELHALGMRLDSVPVIGIVTPGDGSGPASGNLMRSDHAPFWLAGQNALFLTDTANFRNPNYHRDTDVPATLDADFLTRVTQLSAAGLAYWAEGPLP
jgi:hypothetical protein